MNDKQPVRLQSLANLCAGGVGGVMEIFLRQPFDTVKVRMQSTMAPLQTGETTHFKNTLDCFHKTLTREGIRGFYRGTTVVVCSEVPLSAMWFLGASIGKRLQTAENGQYYSIKQEFLAGCFAGLATTVVVIPGERVKCLLQIQQAEHYGPFHIAKHLWKSGGIRTFYRGTVATLCRDVPSGGIFLAAYEWIKRRLQSSDKQAGFSPVPTIIAGGAAGVICCFVDIPPDVLKSRLQTAPEGKYPKGMRSVLKELLVKESLLSLYKGFTPVVLYAFPGSAACFLGYELTISCFEKMGSKR